MRFAVRKKNIYLLISKKESSYVRCFYVNISCYNVDTCVLYISAVYIKVRLVVWKLRYLHKFF